MSFNTDLVNAINNIVENYMETISKKYSIEKSELTELWYNNSEEKVEKKITEKKEKKICNASSVSERKKTPLDESVNVTDLSDERLAKATKPELVALCKSKGLKCGGNKTELLARLTGGGSTEENKDSTSKKFPPVKKATLPKSSESSSSKIVKKLTSKIDNLVIRRNDFDNHEHPESKLVFDMDTKQVVGKQKDDGSVSELTSEDINICKKFKFPYRLPENLDSQRPGESQLSKKKIVKKKEEKT